MERSTFVLAATAALALLLWQWRPIAEPVIWPVENRPVGRSRLQAVFWLGWAVLLISTFLINHFELFGLRQVFARTCSAATAAGAGIPDAAVLPPRAASDLSRLRARLLGRRRE